MQELKQIISTLTKREIRFIRQYYKGDEDKKRLKLFDWVLNEQVSTDQDAATKLYGKKGSAYSHLKGRLKKDLLNLLLFEEGAQQSDSPQVQAEIEAKRKLIQGRILIKRGASKLAVKLLKKTIEQCIRYDLLGEKTLITELLSSTEGVRGGYKVYAKIAEDLERDMNIYKDVLFAKRMYYSVALPNAFKTNENVEYERLASIASKKLESLAFSSGVATIKYYYYLVTMILLQITKEYDKLHNTSLELLNLVESEEAVYSKIRVAYAASQVAAALIYTSDYESAVVFIQKSLRNINKGTLNELSALELMFVALYRLENYQAAQEMIRKAEKRSRYAYSDFVKGKWDFYAAATDFAVERYEHTLSKLQMENALTKDKSGWLFGYKLLEIMTLIELGNYDMIDFRIDALRKLLQRQKHKNIIRIKTIYTILGNLVKQAYVFDATYTSNKSRFSLLHKGEDAYYWNPMGFEIIRFDTWFVSKCSSKVKS